METVYRVEVLDPADFGKCGGIWDMERQRELAERFYSELLDGSRVTYVCREGDTYVGEISLVFRTENPDYTIEARRAYVSHLVVKRGMRRRGIGSGLLRHAAAEASRMGYSELTVGVDTDNFAALKLYVREGFDRIIHVGDDAEGRYFKLMKSIKKSP